MTLKFGQKKEDSTEYSKAGKKKLAERDKLFSETQVSVCEVFHSFQGEGPSTGEMCVFVRFFGCNLDCSWCDSKYSTKGTDFSRVSLASLLNRIEHYKCKRVVFTGGEPMLQIVNLKPLLVLMRNQGYKFEIETNGTHPFPGVDDYLFDEINVSPKLDFLDQFPLRLTERRANYKFVYTGPEDLKTIDALLKKYPDLTNISLMPEGITKEAQEARMEEVIEICKERNWRFCPRVHLWIYGDKRAV